MKSYRVEEAEVGSVVTQSGGRAHQFACVAQQLQHRKEKSRESTRQTGEWLDLLDSMQCVDKCAFIEAKIYTYRLGKVIYKIT